MAPTDQAQATLLAFKGMRAKAARGQGVTKIDMKDLDKNLNACNSQDICSMLGTSDLLQMITECLTQTDQWSLVSRVLSRLAAEPEAREALLKAKIGSILSDMLQHASVIAKGEKQIDKASSVAKVLAQLTFDAEEEYWQWVMPMAGGLKNALEKMASKGVVTEAHAYLSIVLTCVYAASASKLSLFITANVLASGSVLQLLKLSTRLLEQDLTGTPKIVAEKSLMLLYHLHLDKPHESKHHYDPKLLAAFLVDVALKSNWIQSQEVSLKFIAALIHHTKVAPVSFLATDAVVCMLRMVLATRSPSLKFTAMVFTSMIPPAGFDLLVDLFEQSLRDLAQFNNRTLKLIIHDASRMWDLAPVNPRALTALQHSDLFDIIARTMPSFVPLPMFGLLPPTLQQVVVDHLGYNPLDSPEMDQPANKAPDFKEDEVEGEEEEATTNPEASRQDAFDGAAVAVNGTAADGAAAAEHGNGEARRSRSSGVSHEQSPANEAVSAVAPDMQQPPIPPVARATAREATAASTSGRTSGKGTPLNELPAAGTSGNNIDSGSIPPDVHRFLVKTGVVPDPTAGGPSIVLKKSMVDAAQAALALASMQEGSMSEGPAEGNGNMPHHRLMASAAPAAAAGAPALGKRNRSVEPPQHTEPPSRSSHPHPFTAPSSDGYQTTNKRQHVQQGPYSGTSRHQREPKVASWNRTQGTWAPQHSQYSQHSQHSQYPGLPAVHEHHHAAAAGAAPVGGGFSTRDHLDFLRMVQELSSCASFDPQQQDVVQQFAQGAMVVTQVYQKKRALDPASADAVDGWLHTMKQSFRSVYEGLLKHGNADVLGKLMYMTAQQAEFFLEELNHGHVPL